MPDRDAVEAAERLLDRGEQRRENESAREQEQCLRAARLGGEAQRRLPARTREDPGDGIQGGQGDEYPRA
jgi:hypothetical protein